MRRERELMERRKREPQLEQAQDHLVRKIFSRFRRERSVAAAPAAARPAPAPAPAAPDAERGDGASADSFCGSPARHSFSFGSRAGGAGAGGEERGKWGRLLAGGSLDAAPADAPRAFTRSLSARDRAAPPDPAAPAGPALSLKVRCLCRPDSMSAGELTQKIKN